MSEVPKREQVRRFWFVLERLKRLAQEKKLLIDEKKKGNSSLDYRQISRMRAYALVRLADLNGEAAALSEEKKQLSAALKRSKGQEIETR